MNNQDIAPAERWWTVTRGAGPIVATAIHDGHGLRAEVAAAMALRDRDRLREEDPFTGQAVAGVDNHIIVHRSRFEFDLNRGVDGAIYETPEQSWGLEVWHGAARARAWSTARSRSTRLIIACSAHCSTRSPPSMTASSLLDVHSYNHRRDGPDGAPTAAGQGARHQHRHLFDAARAMGVPARSADGGDARRSTSTAAGSTCARMSPSRARASRPASSTTATPARAARSRSSSRNSSWTNGAASPTRPSSTRCAASSTMSAATARALAGMSVDGAALHPIAARSASTARFARRRRERPRPPRPLAAVHRPPSRPRPTAPAWRGGSRSTARPI